MEGAEGADPWVSSCRSTPSASSFSLSTQSWRWVCIQHMMVMNINLKIQWYDKPKLLPKTLIHVRVRSTYLLQSRCMIHFQIAFKKNEDEYDAKQTATSRANFDSMASSSYKVTSHKSDKIQISSPCNTNLKSNIFFPSFQTLNMAAELRRNAHLRQVEFS